MSTAKHGKDSGKKLGGGYTVRKALVNYYLFLMFTVFPLFFTNAYFNIRHDKYYFFMILTGIVVMAELFLYLNTKNEEIFKSPSNSPPKDESKLWCKTFTFTDWAILAFLAVNIISTLLADRKYDALLGTAGRNNGLILVIFYVAIYFVITRFYSFKEYVFVAFAIGSSLVFLLAILNCFYIDPLQMSTLLSEEDLPDFTSTIGNKNLLSSYICVSLAAFVALSVHTKKNELRAVYLLASGLGFAALMTADSDSGILGIGVFLVVFFIWYSRRIPRLKRYFLSLTVMLAFAKLLRLFSYFMNDNSKGMDEFQNIFVYENFGWYALCACAVITALLYLLDYKKPGIVLPKAVPIVLGALALVAVAAVIGAVVYFSVFDTVSDLGALGGILRFNDKWGTHRGFMWIRSMWIFGDFSIVRKIFGVGPDNFYYAFSPYFTELMRYGDSSTNAAHNEYINYLITVGVTGLASYLAFVFGALARMIKAAKKNPFTIVCAASVICYSVQAVVNIAQPITTPLFIIFIALGEATARQAEM